MARSVEALIEPQLLVWARRSAGLNVESAANKVQVKPERLESWERGEARPTIKQLRKLGKAYKRPIGVFYLSDAPEDFQALRDFRRLPGAVPLVESPELRFEVRRAQSRRDLALELCELMDAPPPSLPFSATLSDRPDEVAHAIRESLGIRYEHQVGWNPGYEAFNQWRAMLEDRGILVFQAGDVEISEVRGFSISADTFPAIVVNTRDSVRGRLFTMLHELTHILLQQGGVCNLHEETPPLTDEQRVEVFSNRVAGATLVPREYLLAEDLVAAKRQEAAWTNEELGYLADRYGSSREVVLRRLLICGRTTEAFYRAKREQLLEEYEAAARRAAGRGRAGFAPPHRVAISSAGRLFVRLVLDSYHQDRITASDVADFLDVRLKHLDKIESEVLRRAS
jgi:Zn-dependent peptidase ImmA (M78 family)/DNA-binding XRE family transcriptional regulator